VVVGVEAEDGVHELSVAFTPGEAKRMRVDGAAVDRLQDSEMRPLVSVFLPDRLELIKGAPSLRRGHLDQFVAALWPSRAPTRRAYAQALAQRNALITQIRSGRGSAASLATWDQQLARYGIALMADRSSAVESLAGPFARTAGELGLEGEAALRYAPRSRATTSDELASELRERREGDLERGFTGHGPHRDELVVRHRGRDVRTYGSQGQQRVALLALLLAEREVIASRREAPPLMLLDDVMSELDGDRRQALVQLLRTAGQALITATELAHIPSALEDGVMRIEVGAEGVIREASLV
jgi:DNA replication and repair protein RecF